MKKLIMLLALLACANALADDAHYVASEESNDNRLTLDEVWSYN